MRRTHVGARTSSEGVGGVECAPDRWVPSAMADDTHTHDQDTEPPTPDGTEPDTEQLRPGSRVVSHVFDMAEWRSDRDLKVDGSHVYLWVVPADVGGTWRFEGGQGELELRQRFQSVFGRMIASGASSRLREGRLDGTRLVIQLDPPAGRTLVGDVEGDVLRLRDPASGTELVARRVR